MKRLFGIKKGEGPKFLHLVQYQKDSRDEDDGGSEEWEGKIRAMKNKISKLDSTVTNSTKTVRDMIKVSNEAIKEEMDELKSNTTKVISQMGMNENNMKELAT